jgi:hypothetical protein
MKIQRGHSRYYIFAVLATLAFLSMLALPGQAARLLVAPEVYKIYIHDIRDNTVVVSWTTDIPSNGKVQWTHPDLGGVWIDADDVVPNTTTHYAVIYGLDADSTIQMRVYSESGGDVTIDDNGGLNYSITLGAALLPQPTEMVAYGTMYQNGGMTPVADAIVYLRLIDRDGLGSPGASQWHAVRTDGSGYWAYDINGIRTVGAQSYFEYTPGDDELQIVWQGGTFGAVGEIGDERYYPAPVTSWTEYLMSLDSNPTALSLKRFDAAASTPPAGLLLVLIVLGAGSVLLGARSRVLRKA